MDKDDPGDGDKDLSMDVFCLNTFVLRIVYH